MRVVFDLEGNGLLAEATQLWCGVAKDLDTGDVYKFSPLQGERYVFDLLEFLGKCSLVVAHNLLGYDKPLLEKLFGFKMGVHEDSLVLSRTLYPNLSPVRGVKAGPHSIEAWGSRFNRPKPEHEDWSVFSEEMLYRCEEDVEILYRLYKRMEEDRTKHEWENAIALNHKLFEILHKQEEAGWLLDLPYLNKKIVQLDSWMERINKAVYPSLPLYTEAQEAKIKGEYKFVKKPFKKNGDYSKAVLDWMEGKDVKKVSGQFCRIGYYRPDLNKNQQVKDYLLSVGWEPESWNTNDKGEKTSPKLTHNEKFKGVDGQIGRMIARFAQCKHRKGQMEGWLKRVRKDGRISQRITGLASTGRAKHSGIVNVPGGDSFFGKQMRRCFTCRPGFRIVGTDSAGCQNRMLAARVNDPSFTKILLEGKKEDKTSIHFVNQKAIKNVAGYDVTYRQSKNLNYAFMFGASNKKLGSIVNMGEKEGEKIRESLLSVSPGFASLVENLTEEWRSTAKPTKNPWGGYGFKNGYIKGLDGRPIFIESEHTILVYMLQSDEAIMMAAAYCYLYKWANQRGWEFGLDKDWVYLAWNHDEYQSEVKKEIAEDFAELGNKAIVKAGEFYQINCPHKGESDIGRNWFETH